MNSLYPEFNYHSLNDDGKIKAAEIAKAFEHLLSALTPICPPSRELSITRTKLEEACFFAKKAMATQTYNQTQENT